MVSILNVTNIMHLISTLWIITSHNMTQTTLWMVRLLPRTTSSMMRLLHLTIVKLIPRTTLLMVRLVHQRKIANIYVVLLS